MAQIHRQAHVRMCTLTCAVLQSLHKTGNAILCWVFEPYPFNGLIHDKVWYPLKNNIEKEKGYVDVKYLSSHNPVIISLKLLCENPGLLLKAF